PSWNVRLLNLRCRRAVWSARPCAGRFPRRGARLFPWPWRLGRARVAAGPANSSEVWAPLFSLFSLFWGPEGAGIIGIERPDFAGLFGGAAEQRRVRGPHAIATA